LIDNELPDAGIILADEVNNEIKIWDAEVSCRGGYHWVMGDVNSHTFADPPCTPTFVPNGTPGPKIPGLASMHAIEVLERFLPLKFWAEFSQEIQCCCMPVLGDLLWYTSENGTICYENMYFSFILSGNLAHFLCS